MRYLAFAPLAYALDIMRPLQAEARRRGDEFRWFAAKDIQAHLSDDETNLPDTQAVSEYKPDAVFSPVDWVPYWFPGIKVMVFHGFDTNKRNDDVHFRIRGWYDLFLTQGPSTTLRFQELAKRHGYFAATQTGWAKLDPLFDASIAPYPTPRNVPVILYASTFSEAVCSIPHLSSEIEHLLGQRNWHWLLTTHPKTSRTHAATLQSLAARYQNADYVGPEALIPILEAADIIVCDTSSIIFEFILQRKPAVTFRNHLPGPHLIDIQEPSQLEGAIDLALSKPDDLMQAINDYGDYLHPYRDGLSAARCLDAVDSHLRNFVPKASKPRNLFRKWQLRRRLRKMGFQDQ